MTTGHSKAIVADSPSTETWLAVPGYEGLYEVSDWGRVRSVDRTVALPDGRTRFGRGRLLSTKSRKNYPTVNLWRGGTSRKRSVHVLVLTAFVGPPQPGEEACHDPDPDPSNVRLDNLRWGTHADNMRDRDRHGRGNHWKSKVSHCPDGHEYTPENTKAGKRSSGQTFRICLACNRKYQREWMRNRRSRENPS